MGGMLVFGQWFINVPAPGEGKNPVPRVAEPGWTAALPSLFNRICEE